MDSAPVPEQLLLLIHQAQVRTYQLEILKQLQQEGTVGYFSAARIIGFEFLKENQRFDFSLFRLAWNDLCTVLGQS